MATVTRDQPNPLITVNTCQVEGVLDSPESLSLCVYYTRPDNRQTGFRSKMFTMQKSGRSNTASIGFNFQQINERQTFLVLPPPLGTINQVKGCSFNVTFVLNYQEKGHDQSAARTMAFDSAVRVYNVVVGSLAPITFSVAQSVVPVEGAPSSKMLPTTVPMIRNLRLPDEVVDEETVKGSGWANTLWGRVAQVVSQTVYGVPDNQQPLTLRDVWVGDAEAETDV